MGIQMILLYSGSRIILLRILMCQFLHRRSFSFLKPRSGAVKSHSNLVFDLWVLLGASITATPCPIPTRVHESAAFSAPLLTLVFIWLSALAILVGLKFYLIVALVYISLRADGMEPLRWGPYWSSVEPLQLFFQLFTFLLLTWKTSWCILDTDPSSDIRILHLHSVGVLPSFLMVVVFEVQPLSTSIKSNLCFSFVTYTFVAYLHIRCQIHSQKYLLLS